MAYQRIVIGGPVNTGKSHLVLTAPKGVMSLYHDRMGGDDDLIGMEKGGVFLWQGDRTKPRDALMAKIKLLREKEIEEKQIKTIVLDSVTYFQKWQGNVVANNALKGLTLQKHGDVSKDVRDVIFALFALPVHIVLLTHITEEPVIVDKQVVGKIWKHDIYPSIYKEIARECSLMGYTWKGTAKTQGQKNTYGVCFSEQVRNTTFKDAKAPDGWGPGEVADIRSWLKRLEDEAQVRREAALKSIENEADWRVPAAVEEAPKAEDQA